MSDAPQTPILSGRHHLVLAVMALAAGALLWRAVDLQLNHQAFLRGQGDARHLRVVRIPAHRGMLTDRNDEPLAVSTPVDSVWANPRELAEQRESWPALARALELDADQIHRLLAGRIDREFVYLRRHVEPALAARVMGLDIAGVNLQREYRRYYPTAEVSGHVVGFTNVDDVGQEGLELALEDTLAGVDGAKRVIRDRLGRTVEDVESIAVAHPGGDVALSLDRRIQYLAYRALKAAMQRERARAGSVVVLDARTAEVLALVNQPAYNPNNRADRTGASYRNRAVTDVLEPGSTAKPFTVLGALETGRFRPESMVDTAPGYLRVGRHTVRDLRDYGRIDLTTIIRKSSNVGVSKLALDITPRAFWDTLRAVGFGRDTGSRFPGESAGILTHFSEWGEIHRATLAFGYGLSVTPLQLARAYSVIASGGRLRPVSFLRLEGSPPGVQVLSRQSVQRVRLMMEGVVQEGGTGTRARVPGYRVAGKTGTVRKVAEGGYAEDRYVAVFAGMAPASDPRLVVVVTVDEPGTERYYGGQVAAPVFAEVMAGALRFVGAAPDAPLPGSARITLAGHGAAATEAWQ